MSQRVKNIGYGGAMLLVAFFLFNAGSFSLPSISSKTTQATYVTDDRRATPGPVSAGLQALNKQGILATVFERGTVDGAGEVPDQYKVANAAATEIPALVIQAGDSVTRVVKDPKTFEAVTEAAK